jgi:hypothetical protein
MSTYTNNMGEHVGQVVAIDGVLVEITSIRKVPLLPIYFTFYKKVC